MDDLLGNAFLIEGSGHMEKGVALDGGLEEKRRVGVD